jgi:hypothetical protein
MLAALDRPTVAKKPKITVVGMLPIQQQKLLNRLRGLASFNFVDKNRKSNVIPNGQDFVVLMGSFVSHAIFMQAKVSGCGKLIVHHGGVEKLALKLAEIL